MHTNRIPGRIGIDERHARACKSHSGGACDCKPTYSAWVSDRRTRRKIRKTFPTLAAARAWRTDALAAMQRGTMQAQTRRTVRDAATDWLERAERGEVLDRNGGTFKPSTLRGYRADLTNYIFPEFGAVRLADLRRRDVQALVDRLVGRGLSGSKIRNAIMPLRVVCRHAVRRDELAVNPCSDLELPAVAGRRERAATVAEARRLLAALPEGERAAWATAFYCGLRRGELQALAVEHLDRAAWRIQVQRSWDTVAGFVGPKSRAGERVVPVPKALRTILSEHLARTGRRGSDLIFGKTRSEPFVAWTIGARSRRAWEAAGLDPIGLHECRHTYATWLDAAGVPRERVYDLLGHSLAGIGERYRHPKPETLDEAIRLLDAYLAREAGRRLEQLDA